MKNRALKVILWLILIVAALGAATSGAIWWWQGHPLALTQPVIVTVERGDTVARLGQRLREADVPIWDDGFVYMARYAHLGSRLRAGRYQLEPGDTPTTLLAKLLEGKFIPTNITFPEGWTFAQFRQALAANPYLKHTLAQVTDAQLLERLGSHATAPEGLFFPDTYQFDPGESDMDILRRAYEKQAQMLTNNWTQRDPDLPFNTPYEALILASLVERETGNAADRPRVAGVFVNRLRVGMPLQTDPSVIYGLGTAYTGALTKDDLRQDTPWNTYVHNGLPPTPIDNPGAASLAAALHPEKNNYLYFVARGDGVSEFSSSLADHNRNVQRYLLRHK